MDGLHDLGRIIVQRQSTVYLKCSMRENLLKEKHSGGLAGHFGHDKTFTKLSESYFWP
jgi:hypothetical protein